MLAYHCLSKKKYRLKLEPVALISIVTVAMTRRPQQSTPAPPQSLSPRPYDPTLGNAGQIASFYSTLSRPKWKGDTTPRYLSTTIRPLILGDRTTPRTVVKQLYNDALAVRDLVGRATTRIPSFVKKVTPKPNESDEFAQRITYRQLHPHEEEYYILVRSQDLTNDRAQSTYFSP
jgi:hypothetical protein